MATTNRIAVALGLANTTTTLDQLHSLAGRVGLAEIRLDLMQEFDLERLIKESPCPLVITCRAAREGGAYRGSEASRLELLSQASAFGCAYVDVEWDCAADFRKAGETTRVIASRHFHDSMPSDIDAQHREMRRHADVVKLVGFAGQPVDTLPILELIANADGPVIGIAMGAAGLITRLVAPCFGSCLLTYAAAGDDGGTAPGQISVDMMIDHYGVDRVGPLTPVDVYLYSDPRREQEVVAACRGDGSRLRVPVLVEEDQSAHLRRGLEALGPRFTVSML